MVKSDKSYFCMFILSAVLFCSLALCSCTALYSGAEGVKFCAVGELKGTGVHVAEPLLLWERGQTEEKETPLSPSLSHSHFLSLSLVLFPSSSALSFSLPESLAGWKTKRLMRVHSSRSLSLLFIFQITFILSFTSAV